MRASGGATAERFRYTALANLLDAVGGGLKPKVHCIGDLADQGAGHPDFGLYAAGQLRRGDPREGQLPERGAPPGADPALGTTCFDIYLNDRAYWRNVPAAVWHYKLGGYQVLKKWLSYRDRDILGRPLSVEEVQHFADTARRIAAILRLVSQH